MIAELVFCVPAMLTGAGLVTSLVSGKALDLMPLRVPVIVRRAERPREYWAGVYLNTLLFAVAVWIAL